MNLSNILFPDEFFGESADEEMMIFPKLIDLLYLNGSVGSKEIEPNQGRKRGHHISTKLL